MLVAVIAYQTLFRISIIKDKTQSYTKSVYSKLVSKFLLTQPTVSLTNSMSLSGLALQRMLVTSFDVVTLGVVTPLLLVLAVQLHVILDRLFRLLVQDFTGLDQISDNWMRITSS
jgi:hypothetical protein